MVPQIRKIVTAVIFAPFISMNIKIRNRFNIN